MSQNVFQIKMDLKYILVFYASTMTSGSSKKEHKTNLLNWMQAANDSNLVLNSRKCQIKLPQITFYGTIFSKEGMKPDPKKIQAIKDTPSDV